MQEDDELRKKRILNVIYKEQYRLKLGVVYLVCTGFNILALLIFYLIYELTLEIALNRILKSCLTKP